LETQKVDASLFTNTAASCSYSTYPKRQVQTIQLAVPKQWIKSIAFTLNIPLPSPPPTLVPDRRVRYCRDLASFWSMDEGCFFRRDQYFPAKSQHIVADDYARRAHVQRRSGVEDYKAPRSV
jgi:hypothetical protein